MNMLVFDKPLDNDDWSHTSFKKLESKVPPFGITTGQTPDGFLLVV